MIDQAIYKLIGREKISDISTLGGVGFTATEIPPTATKLGVLFAQVQVQTSDMRYYTDGTAPTATAGWYLATNGIIEVWGAEAMANFLCIDDTGSSEIEVRYYGEG